MSEYVWSITLDADTTVMPSKFYRSPNIMIKDIILAALDKIEKYAVDHNVRAGGPEEWVLDQIARLKGIYVETEHSFDIVDTPYTKFPLALYEFMGGDEPRTLITRLDLQTLETVTLNIFFPFYTQEEEDNMTSIQDAVALIYGHFNAYDKSRTLEYYQVAQIPLPKSGSLATPYVRGGTKDTW